MAGKYQLLPCRQYSKSPRQENFVELGERENLVVVNVPHEVSSVGIASFINRRLTFWYLLKAALSSPWIKAKRHVELDVSLECHLKPALAVNRGG